MNNVKIIAYKINLLAKMRQYITEATSLTIHKSMILTYFDYDEILFLHSQKKLLDKLDRLQRRALKICLKIDEGTPENIVLDSTGTAKLSK